MKLEFAFLADAATLQDNGLFAVVSGGFDVIDSDQFPAIKHAMALVGRLRSDPNEGGKTFTIEAEMVDSAGNVVRSEFVPALTAQFYQFPHPRDANRSNVTTFCFNYQGARFPEPGIYTIRLSEETQVLGTLE